MTGAEQRALALGSELSLLNEIRARRAAIVPGMAWFTPAACAAWLMGTAHLDARRRALRALLAAELARCA